MKTCTTIIAKLKIAAMPGKPALTTAWLCGAALFLTAAAGILPAQTASPATSAGQNATNEKVSGAAAGQETPAASEIPQPAKPAKGPRSSDQRRAAKLYLESTKLFLNSQFEEARLGFERAAALDSANANYALAAQVARSHQVTALIQEAARDSLLGDEAAARAALARALALDPTNFEVSRHLDELADERVRAQPKPLYAQASSEIGNADTLLPAPAAQSFHLHLDQRQLIDKVFKAYGLMAMIDDSVRPTQVRLDMDDVTFKDAMRILGLVTHTFYVPLDAHHALVANDERDIRERLTPQETETVYLAGLSADDMNEVQSLAKNVFEAQQVQLSGPEHAMTIRAPASTLDAFNTTLRSLLDGRSQVLVDVKIIQVAHTGERNTGAQLPPSFSAFNVFAEEQTLLSQNAALVQQIISSGLAASNDPLAIIAILIASGQVTSPLLSSGFALFGGGLTESALVPGTAKFNLSLNTSDSRELDQFELRMEDGQDETIKEGERYPIQTSSFSSPSIPNIPGLTGAGASGSLGSLLSSLGSAAPAIPMIQYEDLGLNMKVTPKVLRNGDVALNIDLKLDALSGTSIDGNPILNNRAYNGMVTLREGEASVLATEVDKSQSQAISGTPGISEIPGLNNITDKDSQQNYATLVIVMTPHVVRGPQAAGRTAMIRVEKSVQ
jgi:Flp pilus assembly secretin CpaC/tetratricopeptide (TPR) repeat protein